MENEVSIMSDDQVFTSRQTAKHTCMALRRYDGGCVWRLRMAAACGGCVWRLWLHLASAARLSAVSLALQVL